MGGCPLGEDPRDSVVNSRGRHHEVENLWIADDSVFPTALGINPQLSIYAISRLFSHEIVKEFQSAPTK
jgi:choline dehydrogenase-like flavoprotein